MIQFVEMECPNCAGKLAKTGEKTAKCGHCGMEFIIDSGQPEHVTNVYQAPADSRGATAGLVKFFVVLGAVVGIYLAVMFIMVLFPSKHTRQSQNTDPVTAQKEEEEEGQEGFISEFYIALAEKIFGVHPEALTPEELSKLTELHIFWENDCMMAVYTLDGGGQKQVEISPDLKFSNYDLHNFTGLEKLRLDNSDLLEGYLDGVNNLTEIHTNNSPEELASIVPCPEKITSLGCGKLTAVTGIDAFPNLQKLCLKDSDLTDISGLSALKALKDLEIEDGENIADFGVMGSLGGLERLSLDAEGLRDASFLKNMTHLKELTLKDTVVLDVSPLNGLTELTRVCLEDNVEVTDYTPLESLSGLETLELDLGSQAEMPGTENWQNLKSLAVSGLDSIGFLSGLPNLQSLSISGSNCTQLSVLSSLTNLESLKLKGIYGEIADLFVLNDMQGLKKLDLQSLSLNGNVESIFGIPALEELNISDCSFGLDFSAMPKNENLKKLYMNRLKVMDHISVEYDGIVTQLDYDEVNLAEVIGFLSNFPNLEELYTQSNQLTGVEFTESLPRLKKLDITNNYVTDLRPLEKLADLETVWCGENSISQGNSLEEHVTVIFDSEAEEKKWW